MISSLGLNIGTLAEVAIERIIGGFLTLPTVDDWLYAIVLIIAYAVIALPIGFGLNFLQLDFQSSGKTVIKIIATSLMTPAILEELWFRVILLPQPSENLAFQSVFLWSAVSLLLFIIYHPLNGITFFPAGRETFFNPVFLGLAALLGLICTLAYLQSGSVWIPVVMHWFTVVIWLLCLGGVNQLKLSQSNI